MTTEKNLPSAKIYQFPPRGRFAPKGNDFVRGLSLASSLNVKTTACGSSWYHEDAIREDREHAD
jgi:hypothetical protein